MRRWRWAAAGLVAVLLLAIGVLALRPTRAPAETPFRFADPAAEGAYLRATYDWTLRTRDSLQRAIGEYGEAIRRDPRAAPAYAGLANTYLLLREFGSMPDAQAYPRAKAAAQAAVALAPGAAAPHRALAFVAFWHDHDRATARREFQRALALAPDDPLSHHWYATALSANGEQDAALIEIARAREMDPASTAILADGDLIAFLAGRTAPALAALRDLARHQPQAMSPHAYLALIALWEGRDREYLGETGAQARLRGDQRGEAEAAALARAAHGPRALAAALLARAQARAARADAGWFEVATLASLSGKHAEAVTALGRACRAGDPATVGASGSLYLSRSVTPAQVRALCGWASLRS